MSKRKLFSKSETSSLITTFFVLIIVAVPNFVASSRRARDQVRRDDLGNLVHNLDSYFEELGVFPPSSGTGEIMDCLKPGDKPYKDIKGNWIIDPIACLWGKDKFVNLITEKIFISTLPQDPKWEDGREYFYRSKGSTYQIFAALEGKNEAEYSQEVIDMGINCGNEICNMGRSYGCDIPKSLEDCEKEVNNVIK